MKRDFLIGIFFLIAIVLFVGGVLWIKGKDPFGKEKVILARFSDASGIEPGIYVYLRGVKVGKVKRVKITPDGVIVELTIRKDVFLPEDTKVEAKASGLLEERILSLIPGQSTQIVKKGMILEGMREDDILEILKEIDIKGIIETLEAFRDFAQSGKEILAGTAKSIENLSKKLEEIGTTAAPKIESASNELKELNSNLKEIVETFKGGALGSLISDTLFYRRLYKTLIRLDSVLGKFQKEPVVRVKLF
ncbi:MAG: MlaD family protein [candidate division WOR-3 bacterium]